MINAGILSGDYVIIRRQPEVENGEIGVALVDGEDATLKRIYVEDDGKVRTKAKKKKYITGAHGSGSARQKAKYREQRANRHKR